MKNGNRPYFLLSFIPAVAYWYIESNYGLQEALIGGMLLGFLEMALEKKFTGHVHTLSKLNLILIIILGGISLIAHEGIWFKLQPTFTGVALSSFLIWKKIKNESLMVEMLKDLKQTPPFPPEFYKIMEWHMCLFLIGFAAFMAYIALKETTATWLFWKTGGFYIVFGGFMVVEIVYLQLRLRRLRK